MNRSLVMLIGGVAGAATGVAAALLLAPAAGKEMRRGLRQGARSLGSAAQNGLSKGKIRVTELVTSGSEVARQVRGRAEEMGGTLREQAQRARAQAERTKEQIGKMRGTASSAPDPSQAHILRASEDMLAQASEALSKVQSALDAIRRQ